MTSRNKASIFKPKLYTATLVHKEPDSVYEAIQNPEWLIAMKEDYTALVKKWHMVPSAKNSLSDSSW